jgi:hypothetical protein
MRRSDDLSRIVRAAAGGVELSDAEFAAVRDLLEKEGTWVEVGRGTVEDLAALIGSCLADRAGRESLVGGRAIAGALLDFAVRDLEPEWFQQVLFAQLDRLEVGQASALDKAMLAMHADLATLLARQDVATADRFARVTSQLIRVLDGLPPGPAGRGEVALYLATLIDWLNSDPWPQDARAGTLALTPAVIERKLRIVDEDGQEGQELDADDLARRCVRLVVLGGPGSGKTWLARRTARLSAEAAQDALQAGAGLDELELPLYTTCARLLSEPPGGGIRHAIVASALGQLPDLGGTRILHALAALFEERNAPTLLIVDSLDEARGVDDRIRQADSLPAYWRIMLTTRPGAWNSQLAVGSDDPSRRAGVLRPLRYPDDVEPFIAAWFGTRPDWAADLSAQLRSRPALQHAATVPLILSFYCIVGGGQPLPSRRAELYAKVIRRMLTGKWRGSRDGDSDPDACVETLRDWAWSSAASDVISSLGDWVDEFSTPRVRARRDDRDALDHVAAPLGPPDADTGMSRRRFVHRSIQEHLVAEHVAFRMTPQEAAAELVKHLWYDPDWEYSAPAALAVHPQRDQVLNELIGWLTGGNQLAPDLGAVDGCWEIRRFLARVAQESGEDAWSVRAVEMIGQARLDLAVSRHDDLRLVVATDWPRSNRPVLQSLLSQLAAEVLPWRIEELVGAVARLPGIAAARAQARQALLGLLAQDADPEMAGTVARAVARLAVTAEERIRTRHALLGVLAHRVDPDVVGALAGVIVGLVVTAEERAPTRHALLRLFPRATNPRTAGALAGAVADLAVTAEERVPTRQALLRQLAHATNPGTAWELAGTFTRLDPPPPERAQARVALLRLLADATSPESARHLAGTVAELDPSPEDRAEVRRALLGLVAKETDPEAARRLGEIVAELDPSPQDRAKVRQALLDLLAVEASPWAASRLARAVAELDPSSEDRAEACRALLGMLAHENSPRTIRAIVGAVVGIAVTAEERIQARCALLILLVRETSPWTGSDHAGSAWELAMAVADLDPVPFERSVARTALLRLLVRTTNPRRTSYHVPGGGQEMTFAYELTGVGHLPMSAEERDAQRSLITLLVEENDHGILDRPRTELARLGALGDLKLQEELQEQVMWEERDARRRLLDALARESRPGTLADAFARLAVTAEERAQARRALLSLLADAANPWIAIEIVCAITGLELRKWERVHAQQRMFMLFPRTGPGTARQLADVVAGLAVTAEEREQARHGLFDQLADETDPETVRKLADVIAGLAVTAEEREKARHGLLGLLGSSNSKTAWQLARAVAELDPEPRDRARARHALLRLLANQTNPETARQLGSVVAALAVTAAERERACHGLLRLLATETSPETALQLARIVAELDPGPRDRARARHALLRLLAAETSPETARQLAKTVAELDPGPRDRAQARHALLRLLAAETSPETARQLAKAVAELDPGPRDRARARHALLRLLTVENDHWTARELVAAITELGPAPEDQVLARQALLRLFAHATSLQTARQLADAMAGLSPAVADLRSSGSWPFPPSRLLLATARQNTETSEWIDALPSLSTIGDLNPA